MPSAEIIASELASAAEDDDPDDMPSAGAVRRAIRAADLVQMSFY